MTTIAVLGATGTAGRPLTEALRRRDHAVRAISRSAPEFPADLDTGRGLAAALEGCEVAFDVSNAPPRAGRTILPQRARRLADAAASAGVSHLVCLSIAGIDYVPFGYYRGKLEQEAVVRDGPTPWTIVRCTQFHELLAGAFTAMGRLRVSPRGRIPVRPIAAGEAAEALAELAGTPPAFDTVTVSGPATETVTELARTWARRQPRRLVPVPLPLPPKLGRALRGGALVGPPPHREGTIEFARWLG